MNTNIIEEREYETSIGDAIAKGALLWAPVYAVVTSVAALSMAPETNSGSSASYSELLLKALLLFSPLCIGLESLRWAYKAGKFSIKRMRYKKEPLPKLPHFVPPGAKARHI